ncbi:MAG: hypothetical protein C0429_13065 [Sphingopyxis sp.]|nr:hypothetical protein [Sphingopyxis sp.]
MSRLLSRTETRRLADAIAARSGLRLTQSRPALNEAQAVALWRAVCAEAPLVTSHDPSRVQFLRAEQMARLNLVLTRQSGGLLGCAQDRVTIAEAYAYWRIANAVAPSPVTHRSNDFARRGGAAAAACLAALPLAACATLFGGNVKGNFSCSAPGGTCAPSTVIDDAALATIQNARPMTPSSGRWPQPHIRGEGKIITAGNGVVHRDRRVVKVVFPSYVDQRGYLHEARVVHAVADAGGWMELGAAGPEPQAPTPMSREQAAQIAPLPAEHGVSQVGLAGWSLARGQGGSSTQEPDGAGVGARAPDPASVAAARARGLGRRPTTPAEIKAAVDEQLRGKAQSVAAGPGLGAESLTQNPQSMPTVGPDSMPPARETELSGDSKPKTKRPADEQPAVVNQPTNFPGRVEQD